MAAAAAANAHDHTSLAHISSAMPRAALNNSNNNNDNGTVTAAVATDACDASVKSESTTSFNGAVVRGAATVTVGGDYDTHGRGQRGSGHCLGNDDDDGGDDSFFEGAGLSLTLGGLDISANGAVSEGFTPLARVTPMSQWGRPSITASAAAVNAAAAACAAGGAVVVCDGAAPLSAAAVAAAVAAVAAGGGLGDTLSACEDRDDDSGM